MSVQERAASSDADRARAVAAAASLMLPGARVRDKLAAGVPLLHVEDVRIDPEIVRASWSETLRRLAGIDATRGEVQAVRLALDAHRLHAEHVTAEAVAGHAEHVRSIAEIAGVDAEVTQTLADQAARVVLGGYAERLGPALALGDWERGYCPICGGWPASFAAGPPGNAGRLRCGRCDTEWVWHAEESAESHPSATGNEPARPGGVGFRLELRGGDELEWDAFDDE